MEKKKKIVILAIISIILVCIILMVGYFVNKKFQLVKSINNGDFVSAGKFDENFYNSYSQNIIDVVNKNISDKKTKEALTIYENLFNYILSSKNIDYDINSELCYKYSQVDEYLTQEIRNDYIDAEYKYIVEQANDNKFEDRTTYLLFSFIFENKEYNSDKKTQYSFLKYRYEELKNKDTDCRTVDLSYLKECFIKLGDFENSSQYTDEINKAIKWQGTWIGFRDNKLEKPRQLAISYFGNKVYENYVFNSTYTYHGTYSFSIIDENTLELVEIDGETSTSKARIILNDEKINFTYHLVWGDENITFVRETADINYAVASNNILSKNPIKTIKAPQIGMTSSEVKSTNWGNPDKINKDTYSWGTTEQWVYNNKGYIYFRNGIVTSISER